MSVIVNPNASNLDQQQILQRAFDESADRLRVDAAVSIASITGDVIVDIDAATGDNIAIANADGSKKVTVTSIGAVNALDVNIANQQIVTVAFPLITNIAIPLSATEQTYNIPMATKRFSVKVRGSAQLNISYVSGTSGTIFSLIPVGSEYIEENLALTAALPIYFQVNKNVQVLEIICWS